MSTEDKKIVKFGENQNIDSSVVNKSRRSFAKVGVVTPFILTLANRPAWGSNLRTICSVSGFDSAIINTTGNFSGVFNENEDCGENVSHGFWKGGNGIHHWPTDYLPFSRVKSGNGSNATWTDNFINENTGETKTYAQVQNLEDSGKFVFFDTVFGTNYDGPGNNPSRPMTLLEGLRLQGGSIGSGETERNLVGMLLNVLRDNGPLPLDVVTGYYSGGPFTVAPNIVWTKEELLNFINFYVSHGGKK